MLIAFPVAFVVAALTCASIVVVGWLRRPALPRRSLAWGAVGLILLVAAAGGVQWQRSSPADVVVMVDCSSSTRTAVYRDRQALIRRVESLLPTGARVRYLYFADHVQDKPNASADEATLTDFSDDKTVLAPPPCDAVLLFSDGRFASVPPAVPPVFVAIDPRLDSVDDGAVTSLELRDINDNTVAITIRNTASSAKRVTITGAKNQPTEPIGAGTIVLTVPRDPAAMRISARVRGITPDPWPENDQLTITPPPPAEAPRWWVGSGAPDSTWRRFDRAGALPTDAAMYLLPSAIVLHNVAANELSPPVAQHLRQYVRDLGGTLILIGGDRAFAAGGYPGSVLEALSPLASTPPQPTTHWILLVDSSGSMATTAAANRSRWDLAVDAVRSIVPSFPPSDLLSIAGFARDVQWWTVARPVDQAIERLATSPPADIVPQGPTNLQSALERIASQPMNQPIRLPTELLVVTDADAKLDDPPALGQRLTAAQVRLNVLAIGDAPSDAANPLRQLCLATGGSMVAEKEAARWRQELEHLALGAAPKHLEVRPISAHFDAALSLTDRSIDTWNRTWPKANADAVATSVVDAQPQVLAARHEVGLGQVVAMAFDPAAPELSAMLDRWQAPPRDPRFNIAWQSFGSSLRVRVDAQEIDHPGYLNGLRLTLALHSEGATADDGADERPIPQIAPGQYEIDVPAPRQPQLASVVLHSPDSDQPVGRFALAGRYAPEFDAIGNDRAALRDLAHRSGGRVIEPGETNPIDLSSIAPPARNVPLTSAFACLGTVALGVALVSWKRS